MIVCADCGAKVPEARFCPNCGKAMRPIASPSSALADRRVVSVMFAEVVGLAGGVSGDDDPEAVKAKADACLRAITAPIYRFGGTIDKFIGGSVVMALFGAPVAHEDDPERAVRAAWEMRRETERFGRDNDLEIALRVGINTGLVVAGAVGGREKRDYTVMGDTVNLAQRLEANSAPGEIWVGKETADRARGSFAFRALPPLKVKGKEEPVEAFAVDALQAGLQAEPSRVPLVGRNLELQRLLQQVRAALCDGPQASLVRGEAGIGKSALLGALDLAGFTVWHGQCRSFEEPVPFALVRDLLTDAAGHQTLSDQELSPEDTDIVSWVREGADAPARGPALAGLRPDQLQSRAADTLAEVLLACRPVAIVLEDLQWIDDASKVWLERLVERFRAPDSDQWPVYLALSTRPGAWMPDLEGTTFDFMSLNLATLSTEQSLALAAGILGLPEAPAGWPADVRDMVSRAVTLAEGHPRFVAELIQNLVQNGSLARAGQTWRATAGALALPLPPTIQAAVRSRMDLLSTRARSALRAAAVLGRHVSPDLVRELGGDDSAGAGLEELIAAGVLGQRGNELMFRQDLFREVAYEALLHRTRRDLHAMAAKAMRSRLEEPPASPDAEIKLRESSPALSFHLIAAEDWSEAARYLWLAGQRSRLAGDEKAEATYLDMCLKALSQAPEAPGAPHPCEVWRRLGDLRSVAGDHDAAGVALERALELAPGPAEVSACRLSMAELAERRGDYEAATTQLASALDLPPDAHLARARALSKLAFIRFRAGEFDGCEKLLDESQEEAGGDPDVTGFNHSLRGLCQYRKGALAEAIASHEKSLECRKVAGDLAGVARSLNNLAVAKMESGEAAGSLADSQEALAVARRIGDRMLVSVILTNLGHWELATGHPGRAAEHMRAAIDLKTRLKDTVGAATCRVTLGEAMVKEGHHQEGLDILRHGLAELERQGAGEVLAEAYMALGKACVEAGRKPEAHEALDKALQLAQQVGAAAREQEIAKLLAEQGQVPGSKK